MKRILSVILPLFLAWNAAMALSVAEITDVMPNVDVAPVPMQTPPPKYPEAMRKARISGLVVVTMVVDENGTVLACEAKKSSQPEFESPALEAVANWKFKPALLGEKAVKVRVTIPIRFNAPA